MAKTARAGDTMHPGPEPRQQLIADGAGTVGQVVDGDALAHYLHPATAAAQLLRHVGDVHRDEVHRYATDDRHRIVADVADRAGFARGDAQGTQEAVGVAAGDGGDARGPLHLVDGAVADGLARRYVVHLQDLGG